MTVLTRADRRLTLRLALGLAAVIVLGVPFLLLALLVRANWDPLIGWTRPWPTGCTGRAAATTGW